MHNTRVSWCNQNRKMGLGARGGGGQGGTISALTWSTQPSREARMVGWSSRCMCMMRLQRHIGAGALMGTVSDDWPNCPPVLACWPVVEGAAFSSTVQTTTLSVNNQQAATTTVSNWILTSCQPHRGTPGWQHQWQTRCKLFETRLKHKNRDNNDDKQDVNCLKQDQRLNTHRQQQQQWQDINCLKQDQHLKTHRQQQQWQTRWKQFETRPVHKRRETTRTMTNKK